VRGGDHGAVGVLGVEILLMFAGWTSFAGVSTLEVGLDGQVGAWPGGC
jgi:hypothetical protein